MNTSAPQVQRRRRARTLRVLIAGTALAGLASTLTASPSLATSATSRVASHPGHHHHRPALPATVALPDGLRPEGITSNGTRFYVGSLSDGRIVTGDVRGGGTRVLLPGATGRVIVGLFFDKRSKLVWAVGSADSVAHVWAVSSRSGAVVRDVVVPGAGFLNDLVVTRHAVWVTDSFVDRLTRVPLGRHGRPASGSPTFVPLGGDWPATAAGTFGANGIRPLSEGHLLLDNSAAGGLWSVSARAGDARQVHVSGGPAIVSGDGIEKRGSTIWVVRGEDGASVTQLKLRHHRGGWSARWVARLAADTLDVPSTATAIGHALYVVNARFGVPSPETATYQLTRLPLRR